MLLSNVQPVNMEPIFVTFEVLNSVPNLREVSRLHDANILYISVTLEVLKLLRSSDVRLLQPMNIEFIVSTSEVLKFDKSSAVNALHP